MTNAAETAGAWALLAAGAAWWLEKLVTIEWSYPYCSVRDDGPAGAVFGFPLTYAQASIVTSATTFFIPWLYVLNLAAIAVGLFMLLRPLASGLAKTRPRLVRRLAGTAGSLLLVPAILMEVFVISAEIALPMRSFDGSPEYSQLRPVAVRALGRQTDCTASPFWFGPTRTVQRPDVVGR